MSLIVVNLIYLFFFLSGMTGLMYEVLWAKYLSNIFGSSAYAHTVVLSVFMGGLALGNYFWGKFADRGRFRLLYLYGIIEIAIGLYCLVYPNIATLLEGFYIRVGLSLDLVSTDQRLLIFHFFVNSLSILLPTFLMGGTIPIMAKFITRNRAQVLANVSRLYFLNSAGAVVGSLVCGFVLIRLLGMDSAISVACIINLVIGIGSLAVSNAIKEGRASIVEGEPSGYGVYVPDQISQRQAALVLVAIGLSGFASMLYEVMWIRTLIQFFGSSVYSFATVVAAFIAGIALGSLWLERCSGKVRDHVVFFGIVQGLIAIFMYLSVWGLGHFTSWIWVFHQVLRPVDMAYPIYELFKFLMIVGMLFLPTVFIGMTLPLASVICSRNLRLLGKEVGGVFSVNTLGCLLGTAISGLVLLPWLGVHKSFMLGIFLNALISMAVLISVRKRSSYQQASVIAMGLVLLFVLQPVRFDKALFLSSMFRYRYGNLATVKQFLESRFKDSKILFYKEGREANVGVVQSPDGTILYINGKPDASSSGDLPTELLSGHIPALLHKDPKKVLVIGFGSGVTVGALTLHPGIEKIDCLEISKEVVEAGSFFKDVNNQCLLNPKVRVVIDDAKNFLSFNKEKYDLIISEPTNPWTAGTGSLMTQEAFQKMKASLNEGGMLLQWFHGYEMTSDLFNSFASTLLSVFPQVSVWQSVPMDYLFVASPEPLSVDLDALTDRLENNPELKESLKKINADNIYVLLSNQLISAPRTSQLFDGRGLLNLDRFPAIEFNAPKAFFLRNEISLSELDERLKPTRSTELLYYRLRKDRPPQTEDLKRMYYYFKKHDRRLFDLFSRKNAHVLADAFEDDLKEKMLIDNSILQQDLFKESLARTETLIVNYPNSYEIYYGYVNDRVDYFLKKRVFPQGDGGEVPALLSLMDKGKKKFPDQFDSFTLLKARFLKAIAMWDESFKEYSKVIHAFAESDNVLKKDIARQAMIDAIALILEDRNPILFLEIQDLVNFYYITDEVIQSQYHMVLRLMPR